MRTLIFLIVLCFSLTNARVHPRDQALLRQIISDLEKVSISFNSTPPTIRMTQCKCHLQAMNNLKNLLQNRTQDGESEEDKTRARIIFRLEALDLPTEEYKTCLVERRKRKTNPASGPMLKHYLQHVREVYKKKCPLKDTA
ncbi:hypothetical protein SRHO_G00096520 [Serrasalmus rhombeus]